MVENPLLGVVFHWLGGLASGSFYVPYKGVKKWAWETYWLVGGFFSWIIAPWCLALLLVPGLLHVLQDTPMHTLGWAYFWGAMWGLGGLTFGLTMRYLGMSLGMAVALGFCAAFGTIMPPLFEHTLRATWENPGGHWIIGGVVVCLLGIAIAGMAGMSKEKEMSDEEKKNAVKEFNFTKGVLVAIFSGVMSASFSYGLSAAEPMVAIAAKYGATTLWTGLPKLIIVLLGGFTSNFIWCVILHFKNGTAYQYLSPTTRAETISANEPIIESITDAPAVEMAQHAGTATLSNTATAKVPLIANYIFCAIAGVTWYMQFFFYTMGETQMGRFKFSSWTLHMASIIIFSTLWGIALKEWKGSSPRTRLLLTIGLAVLIGSTVIVGYGNKLAHG